MAAVLTGFPERRKTQEEVTAVREGFWPLWGKASCLQGHNCSEEMTKHLPGLKYSCKGQIYTYEPFIMAAKYFNTGCFYEACRVPILTGNK